MARLAWLTGKLNNADSRYYPKTPEDIFGRKKSGKADQNMEARDQMAKMHFMAAFMSGQKVGSKRLSVPKKGKQ